MAAKLTVWKFDSPDGAEQAEQTLQQLASQSLVVLHDAATVSWEEGDKRPRTRHLHHLAGAGALGGAFWGMLFGLIFFVPLLGAAVGAAAGAFAASLAEVGIDDRFIDQVRDQVTPGTSALFLLSSDAVVEKVRAAFTGQAPELLLTNLADDEEQALRDVFAG
jgi:uncharacterized membrane protein